MKFISLQQSQSVSIAVKLLKEDKIIAFPTDTLYGICAQFTLNMAHKLHRVRKRSFNKPFLLTLPESWDIQGLINQQLSKEQEEFIDNNWPGKVTIILEKKKGLFYPGGDTIALRKPNKNDSIYFYKLLKKLNQPILAPSLNLPGEKVIQNFNEVKQKFFNQINAYFSVESNYGLNYRLNLGESEAEMSTKPSQIWDLTGSTFYRLR